MRRKLNILALCLFVMGATVMPVAHNVALACASEQSRHSKDCGNGSSEPAGHDDSNCSICQMAHTPFTFVTSAEIPVVTDPPAMTLLARTFAPTVRPDYRIPFSCGPPA